MEIGCITKEVRFGKERLAEADFFLMLFSAWEWVVEMKRSYPLSREKKDANEDKTVMIPALGSKAYMQFQMDFEKITTYSHPVMSALKYCCMHNECIYIP